MNFTFDPEKRRRNRIKHGLDLADAERVFAGETFTFPDHRFDYGESRFVTLGLIGVEVAVIAHTETDDEIRVISMGKAGRHEQKFFFSHRSGKS
jgi:uncharacterized DUF497 family protein